MILYVATNSVNGKRYVGMTAMTLTRRIQAHKRAVRLGTETILHHAMRKYGVDAFTFEHVASARDRASLQAAERMLIAQEGTMYPVGYNMTPGGDGRHGPLPAAAAAKVRAAQRAYYDRWTDEQRAARGAAISAAKKGKPQPWARAVGKAHRGRKRSPEFKAAVSAGMKAYVATLDAGEMARRSACSTGKPRKPRRAPTEEERAAKSAALSLSQRRRYANPEERRKTAERTGQSWEKRRRSQTAHGGGANGST